MEDRVQRVERLSVVQRYILGDQRGGRGCGCAWSGVDWKVEGAGGLSESDGLVVEVQKMEVGIDRKSVV